MQFTLISTLFLFAASASAAVNGPCSVSGTPGVCLSTAACSSGGGKSTAGFCPNDPVGIQCCTKTSCGSGGNCRWTSQCTGTPVSNLCPGPADFKCCQPSGGNPTIPTSNCKSHVVTNGYKILNQFPGKVHTVWCYANKPGDHGLGLALDLMVPNRSAIGQTIAEWTMNNHSSLKVKYIIWGQKIWNREVDVNPKAWASWRSMEDRGSDTANHWDHPHVSFFA
ncbi:hypothetical protein BZA05DRAFT_411804 [Tricharina praecox]|uniref:uncharacterized protein n=1 Tax=Tricharina praecox TaxID=43433 RepID=UPI0022206E80|nr:uncharacterized protein BZA05DRAFT_411804 [Tricharina praecox]KAI5842770.1 hypothetical protein BZA05DRAFT_411804 [Tricharina praecox]